MNEKQAAIAQLQANIAKLDQSIQEAEELHPKQLEAARRLENPYLDKLVRMGDATLQQMRDLRTVLQLSIDKWR